MLRTAKKAESAEQIESGENGAPPSWVVLTESRNGLTWVRPEFVMRFYAVGERTHVVLRDGSWFEVSQSCAEICRLMEIAGKG